MQESSLTDRAADVQRLMRGVGLPTTDALPREKANLLRNEIWLTLVGFLERKTLSAMSSELHVASSLLSTWLYEAAHTCRSQGYAGLLLFFVKECLPPAYWQELGKRTHKALGEYFTALWVGGWFPPVDLRRVLKDIASKFPNKKKPRNLAAARRVTEGRITAYLGPLRAAMGWRSTTGTYELVMLRLAADFEESQGKDWPGDPMRIFAPTTEWPVSLPKRRDVPRAASVSLAQMAEDIRRIRSSVLSPQQMAEVEATPIVDAASDLDEVTWAALVAKLEGGDLWPAAERFRMSEATLDGRLHGYRRVRQFTTVVDFLDWFARTYLGPAFVEEIGRRTHDILVEVLREAANPQGLARVLRLWVDPSRLTATLAVCLEECGFNGRDAAQLIKPFVLKLGCAAKHQNIPRLYLRFAVEYENQHSKDWPAHRQRILTSLPIEDVSGGE